jgi:predicted MFS family arabinose efflux permease
VLGGWLTESFGWQWIFAINPPLALIAVALLMGYAPATRPSRAASISRERSASRRARRDGLALSQIGPDKAIAANGVVIVVVAVLGVVALAAIPSGSAPARIHDAPRLTGNRAFVGPNVATLLYAGLSIMFSAVI